MNGRKPQYARAHVLDEYGTDLVTFARHGVDPLDSDGTRGPQFPGGEYLRLMRPNIHWQSLHKFFCRSACKRGGVHILTDG